MKRKCIFLFILIILFSFMISSFCFANNENIFSFSYNSTTYTYENFVFNIKCPYICIEKRGSAYFLLHCFSEKPVFDSEGSLYHIKFTRYESYYLYFNNTWKLFYVSDNTRFSSGPFSLDPEYVWSNFDLMDIEGNLIFSNNSFIKPFFQNKEELETGKFDKIIINSGDYNTYGLEDFYLFSYYYSENSVDSIYPRKEIKLDGTSNQYFVGAAANGAYIYEVPLAYTGIDLVEGNRYGFRLAILNREGNYEYIDDIAFNIGVVTPEEKEQADRDKQFALQEEQNQTSKNIFDTLKELLDFINPFSENFFLYKFLELLIDAIKSLFIPSEDFFIEWSTNMNDWLSDRLGALYYPVDIVVEFFNRIGSLNESGSAVISGDGFEFMGAKVIPAFSYNLNELLTNDILKNIHNIYLTIVDVILYFYLVIMARNIFTDIFGGKYDDVTDIASAGFSADGSYRRYAKYRMNKDRYNRSHGG